MSDAAGLLDSIMLRFQRTDTAALAESLVTALGSAPVGAAKLSESVWSTVGSRISDIASIVETMTTTLGLIPTEAAKLSESVVSTLGSRISDTASIVESITATLGLIRTEAANLSESLGSNLGARISDMAGIVESMTATLGLIRTEAADLSESVVSTVGSKISDAASIVESMTATLGLIRTEAADLSESVVSTLGSRISDTASIADFMTAAPGLIHISPTNLVESIAGALRNGGRTGVGISESVAFAVEVMAGELTLAKVDAPDPVLVGNVLTYTITVSNDGPSDATGVVVRDRLPPGLRFESARSSRGSCVRSSGTVTCELGNFNSGDNATVTIAATPLADAGGTTITNIVSVVSNETDPDSPVTVTTQSTKVKKKVDLAVTMSDPSNGVVTGNTMKYTATVTNHGPSDATGVILTGAVPEGVTFASATPSQGNCQQASGTISCNLGALNNGATATIAIKVTVQVVVNPGETGSVTNTVTAGGNETEPVRGNNTAVTVTEVHRDSDKDGIGDGVENEAPNNGDGVPDKDQLNVTSLRNNTDERFATIKSHQGTELADVVARGNPSPDDAPDEVFSAGFFAFSVERA